MKNKIITLSSLIAFTIAPIVHASSTVSLAESNGVQLVVHIDSNDFTFLSRNGHSTNIQQRDSGLRLDFFDGSYFILNSNGHITRYSAKTNSVQSFSTGSTMTDWDVSPEVRAIILEMFEYQSEVVTIPSPIVGGDCYWEGGNYICRPPELSPFLGPKFQDNVFSIGSVVTPTSNSCSFEQGQAARPWAGHTTFNRCMLSSRLTYAAAGLAAVAACSLPYLRPWATACPGAYGNWVSTTIQLRDRVTECDNSYDVAMHNLSQCRTHNQSATRPAWSEVGSDGLTTPAGTTILYGGFSFGGESGRTCTITTRDSKGNIISQVRTVC